MDRFFSLIHENWNVMDHPTLLPAYALWRMNWIHPFVEGKRQNGSRGLLLPDLPPARRILPGTKLVPERIRENRQPYYAALRAADLAWEEGHFDVSQLTAYLNDLLKAQLTDI